MNKHILSLWSWCNKIRWLGSTEIVPYGSKVYGSVLFQYNVCSGLSCDFCYALGMQSCYYIVANKHTRALRAILLLLITNCNLGDRNSPFSGHPAAVIRLAMISSLHSEHCPACFSIILHTQSWEYKSVMYTVFV